MLKTARSLLARLWLAATLLTATSTLFAPDFAEAQSATQRVVDLNRRAMEAYTNLEVDQASGLLQEALREAQSNQVAGAPLARTYMNLGVVAIGGLSDNGQGLSYFQQALAADSNVQLDPLTSTPDIQQVFAMARRQGPSTAGSGSSTPNPNTPQTPAAGGPVEFSHRPVVEQLGQTAVPVYAEVTSGTVSRVVVHYRSAGMREFRSSSLARVGRGYGYEIPCSDVFLPEVFYYVQALDSRGVVLAHSGTEENPHRVNIVSARTMAAPALPGRAPPTTCEEDECPPNMPNCRASTQRRADGASCSTDAQCASGHCEDFTCEGGSSSNNDAPRFFTRLGIGVGFSYVSTGMSSDRQPCTADQQADNPGCFVVPDVPGNVIGNRNQGFDGLPETARSFGYEPGSMFSGGQSTQCSNESGYCFYVQEPGFAQPQMALRLDIGYYILDWLAVAVEMRIQPNAGQGDLAGLLFGGRLEFQFTNPAATGFHMHGHVGVTVGQVQAFVTRLADNSRYAPWAQSGLGGANLGLTLGYRFVKNFGLYAQPIGMLQFPDSMFNLDLVAGIQAGF